MGPPTLCRALLGVCLMLTVAALSDPEQEEDCSQPDIGCVIRYSSCLDPSWLHTHLWTPIAPYSVAATVGIGVNRSGHKVPVLHINWTVSTDSSIRSLQGVMLSLFEVQTNGEHCVQFQFKKQFQSQDSTDGRPWQFNYNKFEVSPGHLYLVTVQHLPKLDKVNSNSKSVEVSVPGCDDEQMKQTDTCCGQGICWSPNISFTNSGRNLTVEFNPQPGAERYGIKVELRALHKTESRYINAQERTMDKRVEVTFVNIGGYEDCVYNISIWPDMASCGSDCIRKYYAPVCATETPPPSEPPGRWYLWSIAALLTIAVCTGLAFSYRDSICHSETKIHKTPSRTSLIPPVRKKVWLVYSADSRRYVDAVVRLADFLQVAWGLDVVLDRHHVHDIGAVGAMAWLGRQKYEIDGTNGTIVILCSRGAQEKWKAMQNGQQQRVTLRADREHPLGDLFTPALTVILPDFQRAFSYDRYVVAYFDNISCAGDIPSPLEICPKYALTEHLQDLFFRIQRQEKHQPRVQLTVCQEDHASYRRLVGAMETCRIWQQQHADWFENECSPHPAEDSDAGQIEEEDVDESCTTRVYPVIRTPKVDVSLIEPLLRSPDPTLILDPVLCDGPPCSQLEPSVLEPITMVAVHQPLLQDETSTKICMLEPRLAEENWPIGELDDHLLHQDSGPDIQSWEELIETQRRLFYGNVLENPGLSSDFGFMNVPGHDLSSNLISEPPDVEEMPQGLPQVQYFTPPDEHFPQVTDLGYNTMSSGQPDLKTIQKEAVKLLLQNGGMMHINHV